MSFAEFEKQLEELEKSSTHNVPTNENENNESDDDMNELYCVACNKSFKSDKAYEFE